MLNLSCLCGQVPRHNPKATGLHHQRVQPARFAASRGARWAYLHPSEVGIEGTTKGYSRGDKEDPGGGNSVLCKLWFNDALCFKNKN